MESACVPCPQLAAVRLHVVKRAGVELLAECLRNQLTGGSGGAEPSGEREVPSARPQAAGGLPGLEVAVAHRVIASARDGVFGRRLGPAVSG